MLLGKVDIIEDQCVDSSCLGLKKQHLRVRF